MEVLSSCNLIAGSQLLFPSGLTSFHGRKPLKTPYNRNCYLFKMKAAPAPHYSVEPPEEKLESFQEKDKFINSIWIQNRNLYEIYKDIQKYARENELKKALAMLDYLGSRGISTDPETFSWLIYACVRAKSIDAARQVHVHIRINGLEKNELLQTKLVDMYASCGSIQDAKMVFETMDVTSVKPWNALLRGTPSFSKRDQREVLVDSFSQMRASNIKLDVNSFYCLIKSLAGTRSLREGLKTHAILLKNGLLRSSIVRTSLIDLYSKCHKINLAHSVFEEVEEKNVVSWGAMIAGFVHNKMHMSALEYTRWMVKEGIEVNNVILTIILPVIGDLLARKLGQEAHAYLIKTGHYSNDLYLQSALIDMYNKFGDITTGSKVFFSSMERNTISWTALSSSYAANGRLDDALRSIIWMQQEGFKPDLVTVGVLVPVCEKLRALKQGKEIHAYAIKNGFQADATLVPPLMQMYSKCGLLDYSTRLFDNMEMKTVIAWTVMIGCYAEHELLYEALDTFRSMQLSEQRPDSVTMSRIMLVCGKLEDQKLGKEIHGHVLRKGYKPIPFISSEIVRMYGKCGSVDKARIAFDTAPVKVTKTWTEIIEAYGCNGLYEEAMHLFYKMLSNGCVPNHYTFKVVLCICSDTGFADEAQRIFTLMTGEFKIRASEEHYCIIIDLLTRLGRVDEANNFVQLRSALV